MTPVFLSISEMRAPAAPTAPTSVLARSVSFRDDSSDASSSDSAGRGGPAVGAAGSEALLATPRSAVAGTAARPPSRPDGCTDCATLGSHGSVVAYGGGSDRMDGPGDGGAAGVGGSSAGTTVYGGGITTAGPIRTAATGSTKAPRPTSHEKRRTPPTVPSPLPKGSSSSTPIRGWPSMSPNHRTVPSRPPPVMSTRSPMSKGSKDGRSHCVSRVYTF
mmetsp:Transcript_9420/g.24293  ORF Transcript_9420/g.24293 Transcript_9420/m.24293 type:complete len:218 (-) Transcript_9420:595-1248(-)